MIKAKPWMSEVRTGHKLRIIPRWNQTERKQKQIPVPCEVVKVETGAYSQSGIMFAVYNKGGTLQRLDAAWFEEPSNWEDSFVSDDMKGKYE